MSENSTTPTTTRPLGVVHLIFGLVFSGIAALWLIGEANDTDTSDLAAGFPAVLIGAGIIGLAAALLNQRRAKAQGLAVQSAAYVTEPVTEPADHADDDTMKLDPDLGSSSEPSARTDETKDES